MSSFCVHWFKSWFNNTRTVMTTWGVVGCSFDLLAVLEERRNLTVGRQPLGNSGLLNQISEIKIEARGYSPTADKNTLPPVNHGSLGSWTGLLCSEMEPAEAPVWVKNTAELQREANTAQTAAGRIQRMPAKLYGSLGWFDEKWTCRPQGAAGPSAGQRHLGAKRIWLCCYCYSWSLK